MIHPGSYKYLYPYLLYHLFFFFQWEHSIPHIINRVFWRQTEGLKWLHCIVKFVCCLWRFSVFCFVFVLFVGFFSDWRLWSWNCPMNNGTHFCSDDKLGDWNDYCKTCLLFVKIFVFSADVSGAEFTQWTMVRTDSCSKSKTRIGGQLWSFFRWQSTSIFSSTVVGTAAFAPFLFQTSTLVSFEMKICFITLEYKP